MDPVRAFASPYAVTGKPSSLINAPNTSMAQHIPDTDLNYQDITLLLRNPNVPYNKRRYLILTTDRLIQFAYSQHFNKMYSIANPHLSPSFSVSENRW